MSEFPETRDTLLAQVQDPANREAWEMFARIYRPVIVRIARARGLQHADAQDLSQQVLMAVASAIGDWERRDESTRFRHWLSRVTRNAILNALMRRPKDQAVGGSSVAELLREAVDRDGATTALIETELRRELYLRAAERVIDSLVFFVDELADYFRLDRLNSYVAARCIKGENAVLYSTEHWTQFNQFTSLLTLTFELAK